MFYSNKLKFHVNSDIYKKIIKKLYISYL